MSQGPGKKGLVISLIIIGSSIVVLLLVIIIFISPLSKIIFPEESAPTLALVVTEPPTLDSATGKYRVVVEALVTGNPEPEVLFNRNDGLGAVARNSALILLVENETFMLTAIATNSFGEARAALEINNSVKAEDRTEVVIAENLSDSSSGNAQDSSNNQVDDNNLEGNEQEANINGPAENDNNGGDAAEANNNDQVNNGENQGAERIYEGAYIYANPSLSGSILQDTEVKSGVVMVGDATNNKQIKGFLSFDISEYSRLNGFEIDQVELCIYDIIVTGKPGEFASDFIIDITNYGPTLDLSDFYSDRICSDRYPTDYVTRERMIEPLFSIRNDCVSRYFNQTRNEIQFMLSLNNITDFDGTVDAFVIYLPSSNWYLNMSYSYLGFPE
jgi:hypothetical protein